MNDTPRIMVISVKAGAGHIRAAQALVAALRAEAPRAEVCNIEALAYTNKAFAKSFRGGYETLARDLPSVWGMIYESFERSSPNNSAQRLASLFDSMNAKPLKREIKRFDPDAVICTHYLPAEVIGPWRRKGKLRAPIHMVLTDYDIHTMWIQEGVGHYYVATEEMAYALTAKGIGSASVEAVGIPVLPEFSRPYPPAREMRERLGLRPDVPTILMAAGGFGLIRIDKVAAQIVREVEKVQLLAVAGNSEKLRQDLEEASRVAPGRIVAYGFVDNMHELMAASDFMVAKPGGLTASECLTMGLPLMILNPIPGQEERNADYLLECGAALKANSAAHLVFKIRRLLEDPSRLASLAAAARLSARPQAARTIAARVLANLAAPVEV